MVCSLMVWQWILLCLLSDASRVNRLVAEVGVIILLIIGRIDSFIFLGLSDQIKAFWKLEPSDVLHFLPHLCIKLPSSDFLSSTLINRP